MHMRFPHLNLRKENYSGSTNIDLSVAFEVLYGQGSYTEEVTSIDYQPTIVVMS